MPLKFANGANTSAGDVTETQWWTAFNDPKLNRLIEKGIDENLSVLQAIERIEQARANVVTAGAGALPAIDVSAQEEVSETNGSYYSLDRSWTTSGTLAASWVLDLFGQYRRARQSAEASLDSAYSSVDVARLTFISDIANSYVHARYYQERIAVANRNVKSRQDTLNLTKFQFEAGAASRLDVVQAQGLVNSTLSEIPGLKTSFLQAANHVSALLGIPVSTLLPEFQGASRQPVFSRNINAGIPADLIRNRPDIRKAEQDLAAAVYQIGVAQAQLYPSLTLNGSITPSYVFSHANRGTTTPWSFGPALNLPILDGGALRANVRYRQSAAQEAYLVWKQTVISATEQVANALAAVEHDAEAVATTAATVRDYQEALELSMTSYRDGAASLLDVLDAQRSVATAEANLAQARMQLAADYITLNVAIGSGHGFIASQKRVATKK